MVGRSLVRRLCEIQLSPLTPQVVEKGLGSACLDYDGTVAGIGAPPSRCSRDHAAAVTNTTRAIGCQIAVRSRLWLCPPRWT